MAKSKGKLRQSSFDLARKLALALPGVVEGTSYGTPGFKVAKKLFMRFREDNETLVIKIEPHQRTLRMKVDPESFFITDHYAGYDWMLVRVAIVDAEDLAELIDEAWRLVATKKLIEELEFRKGAGPRD